MKRICTACSNCCKTISPIRHGFLFGVLLLLMPVLLAAQVDTVLIVRDTVVLTKPLSKKNFIPNPRKAMLYGIIPGGGQIYNRRYWKVPLVYGAIGGLGYFTYFNTIEYRRFKNALDSELKGVPHEFSSLNLPASVLRNQRNLWRKNMEQSYIFLTLTYFAQIAEAYVDAHLQDFDDSDDLGFRVRPSVVPIPWGMAPSLAIQIPIGRQQPTQPPVALP